MDNISLDRGRKTKKLDQVKTSKTVSETCMYKLFSNFCFLIFFFSLVLISKMVCQTHINHTETRHGFPHAKRTISKSRMRKFLQHVMFGNCQKFTHRISVESLFSLGSTIKMRNNGYLIYS